VLDKCHALLVVLSGLMNIHGVVFGLPMKQTRYIHRTFRHQSASKDTMFQSSKIEVEEKFCLHDRTAEHLESRLSQLGFAFASRIEMEDWYFDSPNFNLLRKDCWLRYRTNAQGDGQWQLKIGKTSDHTAKGRSTIYTELEGEDAVEKSCDLLNVPAPMDELHAPDMNDIAFDGYTAPVFPVASSGFIPFARIFTQRSSWKALSESLNDLSVDLDLTDFGYAVGEVELLVDSPSDIATAQHRIRTLIEQLQVEKDAPPATGKLEFYLEQYRPDLYDFCVEIGVLRGEKTSSKS